MVQKLSIKKKTIYNVNETEKSKTLEITWGVSQGSILGPLLFLLYVNDLNQASTLLESIMVADDTNLFILIKTSTLSCVYCK